MRLNVVVCQGLNESLLEISQVEVEVAFGFIEIENGISNQLSRSVIGALSSTIDFNDRMREV